MTGLTDYSAKNYLNYIAGLVPLPSTTVVPAVFLALMTVAGTDGNTGFTEVSTSGTAYARVQVGGSGGATNAATATSSNTLHYASTPAWIVAGMTVYDITSGALIGTVASVTGTTVVLTANAASAVASGDNLSYSIWPQASGSAPSSISNGAVVNFLTATGSGFGTVTSWALFDALTGGDLLWWDYLGAFNWLPATVSAASPGVITSHAHGMSNGNSFVFSTEYGGTQPTFSAGNFTGLLTAAGVTTDTLDVTGVNTSATGDGLIRQVTQQSIPTGVAASFAASTFTLSLA